MKNKINSPLFSSFYIGAYSPSNGHYKQEIFRSDYELRCSVDRNLELEEFILENEPLDVVRFNKKCKVQIFFPEKALDSIEVTLNGKNILTGNICMVNKGQKILIKGLKNEGSTIFIPILYLIESGGKRYGFLVPVPAYAGKKFGWELPIYHFLHPKSREYILPFLWDRYPQKYRWVFDLLYPYTLDKASNYCDGIFYWAPFMREGRPEYLYNFTGEPAKFYIFFKDSVEVVEVPPNSRREYRKLPELVVAVGPYRLEWFPVNLEKNKR